MSNQQEFCFYVYNIRLINANERTPKKYKELLQKLLGIPEPVDAGEHNQIIPRTVEEYHIADTPVLVGSLLWFSNIEINPRDTVDSGIFHAYPAPDIHFTNFKEFEYIFIPSVHRFCVLTHQQKLPLQSVQTYLEKGLKWAAFDQEVHVNLEKSEDFLKDILDARHIQDIKLHISFSNQDLNDEYTNLVDNQLRDAEIEYLEISGRAGKGKSVELKKSNFLMGAAGLVPSNGRASARIINRKGEKETVDTSNYPRTFRLSCCKGYKLEAVVNHMKKTYPRAGEA